MDGCRRPGSVGGLPRVGAGTVVVGTAVGLDVTQVCASGELALSGLGAGFLIPDLRSMLGDARSVLAKLDGVTGSRGWGGRRGRGR